MHAGRFADSAGKKTLASAPVAYSTKSLAKAYELSPGLIRLEIARGRLKICRVGRRIVILRESVDEWLRLAAEAQ
jgi:hypothetical protein